MNSLTIPPRGYILGAVNVPSFNLKTKKMSKGVVIVATSCKEGSCCPIAELNSETKIVTIHDPQKPERGSFNMSEEEWNRLVASAKSTQ